MFSPVLLYAICRVVPLCSALLCCVANAYIGRQIRVVCVHHVCSVCMFCLLACMDIISRCYFRAHTVLQVRHFINRVAFGDHHAHTNIRVAVRVRHSAVLLTLNY